jgi:hypothetical protein
LKRLFCSAVLFLHIVFCNAQLRWLKLDSGLGHLPPSIQVFITTDSLNGRPFIAYYLEANLKDKRLEFTTQVGNGKRYTPSQYYTAEDSPYVVVNGTFFSFETNQNLNVIMRNGKLEGYNVPALKKKGTDSFYYPTRSAIGITKDGRADVAWLFTDTAEAYPFAFQDRPILARGTTSDPVLSDLRTLDQWRWWKMWTAIGGGPVLVKDGLVNVTNKEEQMFPNGDKDKHPRTAMGYTSNNKLIILVIQGRFPGVAEGATLEEEAKIFVDLGCVEALNLDGGGSSCLLVNGNETIQPSDKGGQRAVPGVFIIKAKKKKR